MGFELFKMQKDQGCRTLGEVAEHLRTPSGPCGVVSKAYLVDMMGEYVHKTVPLAPRPLILYSGIPVGASAPS